MPTTSKRKPAPEQTGKLRIGDDWNAINIIALSQSNPLKAVAEFVENSIDAHAQHITILRGRSRGQSYLKIVDDGDGVPLSDDGKPNFKYVATHGMVLILMFDRMLTPDDEIRFSLFKFKTPRAPQPAWDFQYVLRRIEAGREYGFKARLVWKKFVSAEDCWGEYKKVFVNSYHRFCGLAGRQSRCSMSRIMAI